MLASDPATRRERGKSRGVTGCEWADDARTHINGFGGCGCRGAPERREAFAASACSDDRVKHPRPLACWMKLPLLACGILVASALAVPADAVVGTGGCTMGPGDDTCLFSCPLDPATLFVWAYGGSVGSSINGRCGDTNGAGCTAGQHFYCADSGGSVGAMGVCRLDDLDDPDEGFQNSPNEDAIGGCSILPASMIPGPCPHASPHAHTYGNGGSFGVRSSVVRQGSVVRHGTVVVQETNTADCDGDGIPGDHDGDYDTGVGGAFFGYGPWANEPTCNYLRQIHGGTATVNDAVFGSDVWFVIGADDTTGPMITTDPVTGETHCTYDGSITPCHPTSGCGPADDPDDCLTEPLHGSGTTCGAGGDGGYWVFLNVVFVDEGPGGLLVSNLPTAGTITA